jgi:hypothetical protein
MNEIFILGDASTLRDELRAIGVRLHLRAEVGKIGISTVLDVGPTLSRQVDDVLTGHGLRELREGVWGRPDTDEDSLRQWEKSARGTAEYKAIWRTMTEHPDWSDQEVADSTGAKVDDVADYREQWELS